MTIYVENISAPELDMFTRLTDTQLRNRLEPEKGIFIAESPKVIDLALNAGYIPIAMLMEEKHIEGQAINIIARCGEIPIYTGTRELLQQLTGYELTRGILCAFRRPNLPSLEEICTKAKRVAVLEGIVDATNVGAIFRSAAALNVDAVLVTLNCCDPLCRRAVRVSMGTVFLIPWTYIGQNGWPENGLQTLRDIGFQTAAMALRDNTVSIDDPRLASEEKLAILLGTEGTGLDSKTIDLCDYTVKIPMSHMVDSLNVAAAGAVAFWELAAKR